MLSGIEITRRVAEGTIVLDPFDPARVGPNSYDLRLGRRLLYTKGPLSVAAPPQMTEALLPEYDGSTPGFVLEPGTLYLGATAEYTESHGVVPFVDGRSSAGRLGLAVHVTAGRGDVGFKGHFTLELFVVVPLEIWAYARVAQIYYHPVDGEYLAYNGRYQHDGYPQPSKMYQDYESPP